MSEYLNYITTTKEFPVTNHTKEIEKGNAGWCRGITVSGDPFEAEVWEYKNVVGLTVLMPLLEPIKDRKTDSKVLPYHFNESFETGAVLPLGMVMEGEEDELSVIEMYVDYLEAAQLVYFPDEYRNGSVSYVTDVMGNTFASITINLEENGIFMADCFLDLKPFREEKKNHKGFKLVSGGI